MWNTRTIKKGLAINNSFEKLKDAQDFVLQEYSDYYCYIYNLDVKDGEAFMYYSELGEVRVCGIKGDSVGMNLALFNMEFSQWREKKEVIEEYLLNNNIDKPISIKVNKIKKI